MKSINECIRGDASKLTVYAPFQSNCNKAYLNVENDRLTNNFLAHNSQRKTLQSNCNETYIKMDDSFSNDSVFIIDEKDDDNEINSAFPFPFPSEMSSINQCIEKNVSDVASACSSHSSNYNETFMKMDANDSFSNESVFIINEKDNEIDSAFPFPSEMDHKLISDKKRLSKQDIELFY